MCVGTVQALSLLSEEFYSNSYVECNLVFTAPRFRIRSSNSCSGFGYSFSLSLVVSFRQNVFIYGNATFHDIQYFTSLTKFRDVKTCLKTGGMGTDCCLAGCTHLRVCDCACSVFLNAIMYAYSISYSRAACIRYGIRIIQEVFIQYFHPLSYVLIQRRSC